ncbi:MAG: CRISPR-associated protein Cmr1 [Oceanotoga sp.]|uniref:type III-B CRISPR module RAMP protein Cmr1 n=1 Tax=Oceanotoga sp. TaxID=2108366 RepID=UPI002654C1F7|nr:type III-B CRISPR module RAMP protein Cmr1 [Oceanotoga sp.]MDN5342620.1 CRISPR-associated protein Cmr1 [Oceanotoga sp.]
MKKIDIDIRTISPMFSGRGDNSFSLTPQSVRGVLRFWFRAVLPRAVNIVDNKGNPKNKGEDCEWNYKLLKDIESYIFGSTEIKSPFDVIVKFDIKDTSDNTGKFLTNGKYNEYALYGQENRYYLKENSKINIKFIIKRNINGLDKVLFYLLNLTSYLGGFGAKTRKGFGSFEIIKHDNFEIKNHIKSIINCLEIYLKELIEDMKINYIEKTGIFKDEKIRNNFFNLNNISYDIQEFTFSPTFPTLINNKYSSLNSYFSFDTFLELYDYLYKPDPQAKNLNYENSLNLNIGMYIKLKKILRGKYILENQKIKLNTDLSQDSFRKAIYAIKDHKKPSIKFDQSFLGLPINYKIGKDHFNGLNSNKYTLSNTDGRKASQMFIKTYIENGKYKYRITLIKSKITNGKTFRNGEKINDIKFNQKRTEIDVKGNENAFKIMKLLKTLKMIEEGGK